MKNKISIVIPCYNSADYINKTIECLNKQTSKKFEVIIVDDGSDDNTSQICENLLLKYNIEYKIIKQYNQGVSIARNNGIINANGEYIAFLDSDDYINEFFVERMYREAKENNSDVVFCGFDQVTDNKILKSYLRKYSYIDNCISGEKAIELLLKEKIWMCTGSAIYKRDIILNNNILYKDGCYNGEDQEFIIKVLFNSKKISCVKEILMYYYQRENSFVHSYSMKKFTVLGAVSRIKKYLIENNASDNIIYYLEQNKFQREFLINMISLKDYMHDDEILIKIMKNKRFRKKLKEFRPISFNKFELILTIKLYVYLYIPKLYNKNIKVN